MNGQLKTCGPKLLMSKKDFINLTIFLFYGPLVASDDIVFAEYDED